MFAGTRSVSQSTAVCFFASSCVTTSKLRLSHNICHRKRGVRGVFVMPCYAHCQVASVVCYAVSCHGRVECLYKKGTLICRGSTRVYPVESFALIFYCLRSQTLGDERVVFYISREAYSECCQPHVKSLGCSTIFFTSIS